MGQQPSSILMFVGAHYSMPTTPFLLIKAAPTVYWTPLRKQEELLKTVKPSAVCCGGVQGLGLDPEHLSLHCIARTKA